MKIKRLNLIFFLFIVLIIILLLFNRYSGFRVGAPKAYGKRRSSSGRGTRVKQQLPNTEGVTQLVNVRRPLSPQLGTRVQQVVQSPPPAGAGGGASPAPAGRGTRVQQVVQSSANRQDREDIFSGLAFNARFLQTQMAARQAEQEVLEQETESKLLKKVGRFFTACLKDSSCARTIEEEAGQQPPRANRAAIAGPLGRPLNQLLLGNAARVQPSRANIAVDDAISADPRAVADRFGRPLRVQPPGDRSPINALNPENITLTDIVTEISDVPQQRAGGYDPSVSQKINELDLENTTRVHPSGTRSITFEPLNALNQGNDTLTVKETETHGVAPASMPPLVYPLFGKPPSDKKRYAVGGTPGVPPSPPSPPAPPEYFGLSGRVV